MEVADEPRKEGRSARALIIGLQEEIGLLFGCCLQSDLDFVIYLKNTSIDKMKITYYLKIRR
jgi:hypothetical protein